MIEKTTMNEPNIRVLVVDDTATYRRFVSDALAETPGIEVVGLAANGKIALMKIETLRPDVMTLDLEMPEMDGLELLRQLRQMQSEVGAIVVSGTSTQGADTTISALELGAFDFVAKPGGGVDPEANMRSLRKQLRSRIEAYTRHNRFRSVTQGVAPANSCSGSGGGGKPFTPKRRADVSNLRSVNSKSVDASDIAGGLNRDSNTESARLEIVALGISTGGPRTLTEMLPLLPGDLPVPILIVQHMPPVFTKSMADDLNRRCELTVSEAVDGQSILPGHVLIAPGGKQMKVVRDSAVATIRITDDPPENSCRPSVDYLFRSVTRVHGPRAMGVIMTGMGNDGAIGSRQMKQRGASILAQDEASCVVFGMPKELVEEGIADAVGPPHFIAAEIVRRARRRASV